MKSISSILYLFIIIILSSNSYAQTLILKSNEQLYNAEKSKTQFVLNNSLNIQSLNSEANISKSSSMVQNNFDNSYSKYLGLSKADTRFNFNFAKVDPYQYSGVGDYNISMVRNSYEPYYYNSNFQPNMLEGMLYSMVRSCLTQLR